MYFQALFIAITALCTTGVLGIDFSNSKWIWTKEVDTVGNTPVGSRAFRRDFYSPEGKTALSASIIIAADNLYTLYVNGNQVGSGSSFTQADSYCIRLAPDCNIFAVNVTNVGTTPNPAGLLATIEIRYTDGFTDTIVTDSTWHSFTSVPAGFEQVTFYDTAWPAATVEGNYGASPWGTLSVPLSASSPPLDLTNASWIWTNEVNSVGYAPYGGRAFRKEIALPVGELATSASVLISADDEYTLYLQGQVVASGSALFHAQRYVVDIDPPASDITLAIYGFNGNAGGGPAGVIAAVELTMQDCDCGSITSIVTDSTWKFNTTVPANFVLPGFNDSAWLNAVSEGKYGVQPWGDLTISTTVSPASAPLPGAPSAKQAQVVT